MKTFFKIRTLSKTQKFQVQKILKASLRIISGPDVYEKNSKHWISFSNWKMKSFAIFFTPESLLIFGGSWTSSGWVFMNYECYKGYNNLCVFLQNINNSLFMFRPFILYAFLYKIILYIFIPFYTFKSLQTRDVRYGYSGCTEHIL
jgi:hypothetical protein